MTRVCADPFGGGGKLKEKRRRGDCRRVIRDSRRQAADDAPPVVSFSFGKALFGRGERPARPRSRGTRDPTARLLSGVSCPEAVFRRETLDARRDVRHETLDIEL